MKQLHKKFNNCQVKDLIARYLQKKIERKDLQEVLGIKKTRFFALVKRFKDDPENFSVSYFRSTPTRTISKAIETNIIKELNTEKDLIKAKEVPIRWYNYSYIKDILENDYYQKVSLSTIINRAKTNGFYLTKPKRKVHEKEVITNYPGELIQHDSSHHQFSKYANKWYLITSLDDYSRLILYAVLVERETTWTNIIALKIVILRYGIPYSYYVDSYSVYRFVQGRDSFWRNHYRLTDEVNPQWKQVLDDCGVKVTYALSPQAKGKIERPYRWIQDRLVRACYRERISDIKQAQLVLNSLIQKYNHQWIHSTTGEIPYMRFQRAYAESKSLFREFAVRPPYKSINDIFCLRADRMVNSYRKVSINNLELKVPGAPLHERIQLRIIPDEESGLSEVRFWHEDELLGIQKVKNSDLNLVQF
jgi:transposase InsO family protein